MSPSPVRTVRRTLASGRVAVDIVLARPQRCNALDPDLVHALSAALDGARADGAALIHLCAEGRHFSTGGDVRLFAQAHGRGEATAYAADLVGALQRLVLDLRRMPAIIVTAARGAITGGSVGLVFASDLVVLDEGAFIQPYYREAGFAPDGGWCALLPDLVGPRHALALQLLNRRMSAAEAQALGLADRVVPAGSLAGAADAMLAELDAGADTGALIAAKRLVWDRARLDRLEARLDAEREAFLARIGLASTGAAMARLLATMEAGPV